ncbi:MAG TPA: tetratricopeptide repeat protein [Kiritimatiellia bacterium]|nr:tetratricopeptide repeat protein [Kiritimatiellia bacterium]HPS06712.1 tetratricopeptide repeat protein [Kiritimatiellia bacterium]
MVNGFKEISGQKRKMDFVLSAGLGLLAAVVYGLTLSHGVYPGESARLMTAYSGIDPLELPLHPIWGTLVSWVSSLPAFSLPLRLNLFSAACSVVSVVLMYRLMSFLIHDILYEEYSVEYAPRVSVWAGTVSALALMSAVPVWQAATRLQYQSFDLMLVLASGALLASYAVRKWRLFLVLFALLQGVGVVESVVFIPLAPVFLTFLVYVLWKQGELSLRRVAWMGVLSVAGMSLYYFSARAFLATHDGEALGFKGVMDVVVAVWKSQLVQLRSGLPRVNWLVLLLMSVVPWLASGFASFRALNNERSWSQYILHLTLSVLVVLGLTNAAISPWEILKPFGHLPVWAYAMLAMTTGYLVAYWYLLLKVERPKRGQSTSVLTKQTGDWLGLILTYPMAAVVLLAAVINGFECRSSRGAFADRCAKEILDRLGSRTWFVTDGTLDPHLRIMAKERGQELNLLCLQNDMSPFYLKSVAKLIDEKKLFSAANMQRMKSTLDLGILPFIQDWFAMDKEIEKKVAVFGVPDFWYTAGITPVPEILFFSGSRNIQEFKDRPLFTEYSAFWKAMDRVLAPNKNGSDDPTIRLRAQLRRHMGFVANNLGVLLEDLGKDEDAFAVYTYVHSTLDPENVSALFNRFEMARRGVASANASKEVIERELKDFVGDLKQKYPLWSLSRYYGYVRSPELFARLGWGWALSGQTGAALAGVSRAINLLPSDQRVGAMHAMAAVYALSEDRSKTEAVYQDIIKSDPGNRSAMLGLARLAVQEGALEKAKQWLEKAAKSDDKLGVLGVEWAVIHLMNNDVARARLALQEATDLQPKNLQAWAMLAMVQLQQDELTDIEKVILPKMESIAGTVDNYFIQITRAQVAMKKGKNFQRSAREAFVRASMLRPDVPGVKDMILQLDIAMNDQQDAELHARQVLRTNRKHALANYVMGSLRLQEGEYGEAEDFLRRSVEANPSAAALNDLAEVLRRIRKFDEAEKHVRAALKLSPELYVAWETLAVILFEAGKNLDEAEQAVQKSMALYDKDLRIRITLARIQLKKGEIERARETIRLLKSRQSDLSKFDQEALAKLADEASSNRVR